MWTIFCYGSLISVSPVQADSVQADELQYCSCGVGLHDRVAHLGKFINHLTLILEMIDNSLSLYVKQLY